ncbi:MAG: site-specific integrase [Solirubrobacterales bacterium]|nr:site-specific integrase [Solirubrobacterales bacterium]
MRWGSGRVVRIQRKRGPVWYARYRLPSGQQKQKLIGPAWTERGRPPDRFFTKKMAEDWLRDTLLEDAQLAGTAPRVEKRVTFAEAAEEYLRYAEHDRGCKPSTVRGYRSQLNAHLLPAFGAMRLEDITERVIERWRAGIAGRRRGHEALSNKTKNHQLVLMHAVFRRAVKVYGLARNPLENVDRFRLPRSGDIEVFSPEEIWSLVRAAASEIDGAIFLTAAFTGLRRGELLALRWRDVDFDASTVRVRASYAAGQLSTPKSGKVRSVPMAPDVATALARVGQRDRFVGGDDFVFAGAAGLPLDGDALSSRYERALATAGLRRLRFHDLRHTFGTRMIREADIRRVQEWMGHADIQTTMKYLHYESREEDAQLVARAFAIATAPREPAIPRIRAPLP